MMVATYVCGNGNCKAKMQDRGEAGATFKPTHTCGRCGGKMSLASTREVVEPKKTGKGD